MKADSPHWIVMGEPATPAEAAALEKLRELLPEDGITTAWVNLTFIDNNGRSAEVDVLLMTRAGVFLVELKGWHGTIRGDSQRWQHGVRNEESPWLVTDRKAKRLVEVLRDHVPNPAARKTVPFLQSLVVLHGHESTVELDERGRTGVVTLDGYHVKAKPPLGTFRAFLAKLPTHSTQVIDKVRAAQIRALCGRAGFRPTPKTRMVGDYVVADSNPIAEGPDWQDVLVDHPFLPGVRLRLRLYDVPPKAAASERKRVEQLARSEVQITYGIKHEGIAVPSEFKNTDDGPALVFEHDDAELPLDAYLAGAGRDLAFEERVALVQRLGEILRYAHQRHLVHRALSPRRVWVRPGRTGLPHVSIRDWYFGQKAHSTDATNRWSAISAGLDDLLGVSNPDDWLYFAPEARTSTQDLPGVPLDVFGFGALTYLILTGRHPADNLAQLEQKLTEGRALDPRAAGPGMPDDVADVVAMATSVTETERPATITDMLDLLRVAWDAVRRPEPEADPTAVSDPLDAQTGDAVADRFLVTGRRGEGSSGLALAVKDTEAEDAEREVILKIARSAAADRRLAAEADVLRSLDHRRIVRLLDGPIDVDGRRALVLTDAGKETLATRLAKEGRATLGQLQQFGGDLLDAMAYLETQGVFHRDIKPANLGIMPDPGSRKPTLVLFDLSLASESVENLTSGTQGYVDPYLGRGRRQRYDRAAELYAVSATLFEMASGVLPWWPDGTGRPVHIQDPPVVEPGAFEPVVAVQLTALFRKALNPDVKQRFSSADELALAWQEVFAALDAREETAESNDSLADRAVADTPLERAGLSARARSALTRLELATVGELLAVHPARINTIRGLGEVNRKEIQRRVKQWRLRLATTEEPAVEVEQSGTERMVTGLLGKLDGADGAVMEALLGLTDTADPPPRWPASAEVAHALGLTREQVVRRVDAAVTTWTKGRKPPLQDVHDEVVRILAREGRVTTLRTLASALTAERGSLLDGAERLRYGAALLRAAYELDARADEALLELRRSARRPALIALREGADPDQTGREHPTADVLLEAAGELGRAADELVAAAGGSGVVPAVTAVTALRAAVAEVGGAGLTGDDRRLLRLAAAAGEQAALSGFDELYPVTLAPGDAVELALSGKPGRQISEAAVRKSVATRFPHVPLPTAAHELDDLVKTAMPGLVRRGAIYEPATSRPTSGEASSQTFLSPTAPSEAVLRLRGSLRRHGALTLCTTPKRYVRTARELSALFDVDTFDVADLVVTATRELAAAYAVDWSFVVGVDAGQKSGSDWANLAGLVREAVETRWTERLATERPLLVVNAGPLARYGLSRLLAHLLDVGEPRPAARWLLVAMHASQPVPQLEGEPVPLGPSRWITLPADLSTLADTAHSTSA